MYDVQKHPMHTYRRKIYYNANCKTENIIYLLECAICALQYIGETKQQLSKRLNGHRSDANCKPDTTVVNSVLKFMISGTTSILKS